MEYPKAQKLEDNASMQLDYFPGVEGMKQVFCIAPHNGRDVLCKFNLESQKWAIMQPQEMRYIVEGMGLPPHIVSTLFG